MKFPFLAVWILLGVISGQAAPPNRLFEEHFDGGTNKMELTGDVRILDFGNLETVGLCAELDSATDLNVDGSSAATVSVMVPVSQKSNGSWFRFFFRGLPGKDFHLKEGGRLLMRVEFFADGGKRALDGVTKELQGSIDRDRRDIEKNGLGFQYGSVAWIEYTMDVHLPFPEIDTLKISVSFDFGEGKAPYGAFYVDDVRLESIDAPLAKTTRAGEKPDTQNLVPVGGSWFYYHQKGDTGPVPKVFNMDNFDRLVYRRGDLMETPFSGRGGAWMQPGYRKENGEPVKEAEWIPDAFTIKIQNGNLEFHTEDIPDHPTGTFPGYLGNPNAIQKQGLKYILPLQPRLNPAAVAMNAKNMNRALPQGPVGVAINGVVFYNPFDAGMEEAVNIMDRCCGHPDPMNRYHYHKYPVCTRSPFDDQGDGHSKLIGFAFDGFPIYGPYETSEVMAMNSPSNPLDEFNMHNDPVRGMHYHVSPGKFPYIMGGYRGVVDAANFPRRPDRPGLPPGRATSRGPHKPL